MIKLEISPFEGRSSEAFPISQARTSVGRHPTNDIVVNDSVVSAAHAEILRDDDGELEVRDLSSSNGTYVNDEKITASPIKPGDKLRFGDIEGLLKESTEVERNCFDSLAISQAKQAMKKLDQGMPSGSSQSIELEESFVTKAAEDETTLQEPLTPDSQPDDHSDEILTETPSAVSAENESLKARISKLETHESDLVLANEALTEKLAEKSEALTELSGQLIEKESALADEQKETTTVDSAEIETLKARISELEKVESDFVRANESLTDELAEKSEALTELNGQLIEKEATLADEQNETTTVVSAEIEPLKARNSELEKVESDLVRANKSLAGELAEKSEAIAKSSGQLKEKEAALADQLKETAALRAEVDALQSAQGDVAEACAQLGSIQREIESFEPQRARQQQELNDFLAQAEATRKAAIEENAELTSALDASREHLESLNLAIDKAQSENTALIEKMAEYTRKLKEQRQAEAGGLTRIEEGRAQLGTIQQEIESYEPQRAQQQQELNDFQAQAEATRKAAIEENAEVLDALEGSRKKLESLTQAIRDAQQEENVRIEQVMESIRELEKQKQAEADGLARIEEQKAAAEQELSELALSTQAVEAKRVRIETEVAKEEKVLGKVHRKIGWRKKLLKRLKTVARREREVAKKMEEAERVMAGAADTHHRAPGIALPQVQPWDVDRACAERDEAIEEAQRTQQEMDLMKAELKERQGELDRLEARIRQEEQPEPAHS